MFVAVLNESLTQATMTVKAVARLEFMLLKYPCFQVRMYHVNEQALTELDADISFV